MSRPTHGLRDSVCAVSRLKLSDEAGQFDVTVLQAALPRRVVLFAVGAGGNPERHLPLLSTLSAHGVTVVAPHFDRLVTPVVDEGHLHLRERRLRMAIDAVASHGTAVAGIGHSIGASVLLALAGARLWMGPGRPLEIPHEPRLTRLALMTPPTRFFQAPGALDNVRVPILAWAGTMDDITPPDQTELLASALRDRVPFDLRVEEGAGHFSFMHVPPPNVVEPLADRDEFLARLSAELVRFADA